MSPTIEDVVLSSLVFDEVIYPRKDHDPVLVQRYADVLDEIEAKQAFISVSKDDKILDGKHRWLAYRKKYSDDTGRKIKVFRYDVATPHEQLKLAAELNSSHGWQLSDSDKEQTAKTLYSYGCTYDDIATTLSVGKKRVSDWLARTVKDNKVKRDQKIFDLWLACWTQEEIAAAVSDITSQGAGKIIADFETTVLENQSFKSAASHATDFEVPIYNVWKQQEKSEGSKHFGNTEANFLDRLLYLYTEPFDVVVDPFAGGGSTIDVCKKRFRRYFVSDRKPIIERETEIRCHDVTEGLPKVPRWKDVRLVYLDPPYWRQAQGKYSNDPSDLANMSIDDFRKTLADTVKKFAAKMEKGVIAVVIQPTQWNADERQFTDHVAHLLQDVKLEIDVRIQAPYESQQCNAQMVEWAKKERKLLCLSREFIVFRVG